MIKFLYGNPKHSDAEDVLNNVNRYVKLRENEAYSDYSNDDLYLSLLEMDGFVEAVNRTYMVNTAISTGDSHGIKCFVKKVIRKFIQWAFNDVLARQVEYNGRLVQYINSEMFFLRTVCDECINLREENDKLKLMISEKNKAGQ